MQEDKLGGGLLSPSPKGLGSPEVQGLSPTNQAPNSGPSDETAGSQEVALSPLQGPRPTDPAKAL